MARSNENRHGLRTPIRKISGRPAGSWLSATEKGLSGGTLYGSTASGVGSIRRTAPSQVVASCPASSGSPAEPPSPKPMYSSPSPPMARSPPLWFLNGCCWVRIVRRQPLRPVPSRSKASTRVSPARSVKFANSQRSVTAMPSRPCSPVALVSAVMSRMVSTTSPRSMSTRETRPARSATHTRSSPGATAMSMGSSSVSTTSASTSAANMFPSGLGSAGSGSTVPVSSARGSEVGAGAAVTEGTVGLGDSRSSSAAHPPAAAMAATIAAQAHNQQSRRVTVPSGISRSGGSGPPAPPRPPGGRRG